MNKKQIELEVFRKFAKHYPAELNVSSLRKVSPPKPDIEIACQEGKTIAFEISEIIDQEMMRRLQLSMNIKKLCDGHYRNLASEQKKYFAKKYGNSYIYIIFQKGISSIKRQKNIPSVFDYLLNLSPIQKENIPNNQNLNKIIRKIVIQSGKFTGPIFGVDAGGGIADPLIECICNKFTNKYKIQHPTELLLYYGLQPEIVGEFVFEDAYSYAQANINNSIFQRIWIYSLHQDKILRKIEKK